MAEQKKKIDEQLIIVQNDTDASKTALDDLYVELNKMDIHEEITRFNGHLESVNKLLVAADHVDKGKRIDFILQELLRETNTIMAKCSTFGISSCGIDIKVELEKAREQVQNVV